MGRYVHCDYCMAGGCALIYNVLDLWILVGLVRFTEVQNKCVAKDHHFVRRLHDNENPDLHMVVCMLPEQSCELQLMRTIMMDISFKRIHGGWKEFSLESFDPILKKGAPFLMKNSSYMLILSYIAITYTTIIVRNEDAETHRKMLHLIDDIVLEDTGHRLGFEHIHYDDGLPASLDMIWVHKTAIIADAHTGQALGLSN